MNTQRLKHRRIVRILVAFGLAVTLGGCVVVPLGAPGYYRPHGYHYYY